jgi:hypothetical protein
MSPNSGAEALAEQLLLAPKTRDKPEPVRQVREQEVAASASEEYLRPLELAYNGRGGLSLPLLGWSEEETLASAVPVGPVVEELPGMTIVVPREAKPILMVSQVEPEAAPVSGPVLASPSAATITPAASPELAAFQLDIRAAIDDLRRSRDDLRERSRELRDDLRRKREGLRHRSREIRAASP